MNMVIICGKIISKMEFKFIYDRYKNNKEKKNKNDEIYKHISIARCKIKLSNNSIIEIYGYDNIADYMYRYFKENDDILLKGNLDSNMKIKLESCVRIPIFN